MDNSNPYEKKCRCKPGFSEPFCEAEIKTITATTTTTTTTTKTTKTTTTATTTATTTSGSQGVSNQLIKCYF